MNASARFEMNRDYFAESFAEWLRYRSRFRRWQRQIAGAFALAGLIVFFLPGTPFRYLTLTLLLAAIVEGAEFYWYRANWIRKRLASRGGMPITVEMRFDDSGFYMQGPATRGHVSWKGVRGMSETPKGLFLRLGDGMSVYIPKT